MDPQVSTASTEINLIAPMRRIPKKSRPRKVKTVVLDVHLPETVEAVDLIRGSERRRLHFNDGWWFE